MSSLLSPLDRVYRAHVSIIKHRQWCRFAGILAYGKVSIVDDHPTAFTDGVNVAYNGAFVESLSEAQLRFVVLHEAMHKAFRHLTVWRVLMRDNAKLANCAMDFFVNTTLMHENAGADFLAMPPIGIQPKSEYVGKSVKQIYEDLRQQQNSGGGGDGQGEPHDSHGWDEAQALTVSEEAQAQQAKEVEAALRHGEMMHRKRNADTAGHDQGLFGDLLTPEVDWRTVLQDFVRDVCRARQESSWRRPNRRFLADNVYMPSMDGVSLSDIVIGFDTSGSCFGTSTMTRFVTEIAGIVEAVNPGRTHVVYWDTEVSGHQVFEGGQFSVSEMRPVGGGGTIGSVLFDYLRAQNLTPTCIVQFSDGYVGSWGSTTVPTLWALTSEGITAPFGTTIHIKD